MRSALLLSLVLSLVSCGNQNLSKANLGTFPTIDFNIPTNASTGAISLAQESNVLTENGERMDSVVSHINRSMDRLNAAKNLQENGTSSFETEEGKKVTVSIADAAGTYSKQAIVCTGSKPHIFMEWNQTRVHMRKDWNQDPWRAQSSNYKGEILYDSDAGTLEINGYGVPWTVPAEIAADTKYGGSFNTEYLKGILRGDGSFELQAVRAWDVSPVTRFTGDVWFSGRLKADGGGFGKGYRRWNTSQCGSTTFDEESANWCLGLLVAPDGSSQKLAASGVEEAFAAARGSKLKVVDLSDITCP